MKGIAGLVESKDCAVKGVRWNKDTQKWDAQITHNGVIVKLGAFNKDSEAIEARALAEEFIARGGNPIELKALATKRRERENAEELVQAEAHLRDAEIKQKQLDRLAKHAAYRRNKRAKEVYCGQCLQYISPAKVNDDCKNGTPHSIGVKRRFWGKNEKRHRKYQEGSVPLNAHCARLRAARESQGVSQ